MNATLERPSPSIGAGTEYYRAVVAGDLVSTLEALQRRMVALLRSVASAETMEELDRVEQQQRPWFAALRSHFFQTLALSLQGDPERLRSVVVDALEQAAARAPRFLQVIGPGGLETVALYFRTQLALWRHERSRPSDCRDPRAAAVADAGENLGLYPELLLHAAGELIEFANPRVLECLIIVLKERTQALAAALVELAPPTNWSAVADLPEGEVRRQIEMAEDEADADIEQAASGDRAV